MKKNRINEANGMEFGLYSLGDHMGEETAATLGLNIHVFQKVLIFIVSLLTGVLFKSVD